MTTEEIAAQYGVPFPETCKDLNWQKETILCYYRDKFNNMIHLTTFEKVKLLGLNFYAYAPQFHEIAKLLPEKYKCLYVNRLGDLFINSVQSISIDVFVDFNEHIDIKNNNFAQAAAELYLQLKKVNLL